MSDMFDRLQKPFLTVETGEAYQPIRLTFNVLNLSQLETAFTNLACIEKNTAANSWSWYWKNECDDLHFESIDSFRKHAERPLRLATIIIREDKCYINLPSFKRACLAVPFFHKMIKKDILTIHIADFINKVFALDERLPHGFAELFKENELDRILQQRVEDYHHVKERCEDADSAESAFKILYDYTKAEAQKRLPYAERYVFDLSQQDDPDIVFLAFYIFLRGRELVAIKRWFGQTGYTLANAADETIEQVFGGLGVDIIE